MCAVPLPRIIRYGEFFCYLLLPVVAEKSVNCKEREGYAKLATNPTVNVRVRREVIIGAC
jgi:hypothetical protein